MDPSPSYSEYPVVKSPAMSGVNLDDDSDAPVKPKTYKGDSRILTPRILQIHLYFWMCYYSVDDCSFHDARGCAETPAVAHVYFGAAVASTIGFSILAYLYVTITIILKEQLALRGHLF